MKLDQLTWDKQSNWKVHKQEAGEKAQWVLAFGARHVLEDATHYGYLKDRYPLAHIFMASTAGEICQENVQDDTLSVIAAKFEKTSVQAHSIYIHDSEESHAAGQRLIRMFDTNGLKHIFVVCEGKFLNGTELVQGMQQELPEDVAVTGGLAGDAAAFTRTLVGLNETPRPGVIAAIGFYGDAIQIGYGSKGGWDPFGPERLITKAEANVLYELDGNSALDLYKKYLGEKAKELPGSALLFPLAIKTDTDREPIVRTILSIDEGEKSMTFAGNMPVGARAQLMKANFERLIDGASVAAETCRPSLNNQAPDLAILISCVGRKLILGERVEEEVESVMETLGGRPAVTGFYSYGEIAPFMSNVKCELHNQTMTITTLKELV